MHRPGEVHVDDLGPFLGGEPVEVSEGNGFVVGGVVDQNVEAAETLHHIVDELLDLLRLRQVARERRCLDIVIADISGDLFGLLFAFRVNDCDVRALLRERVTDALAKPAIAAGDDRD